MKNCFFIHFMPKFLNTEAELTSCWCQTHACLQTIQCQLKVYRAHIGDDDQMYVCHTKVFSLLPNLECETKTNWIKFKLLVN